MASRFPKVSEEEIEEAFFNPSDLVNTKTTIPLRAGEERWIYTLTVYILIYTYIAIYPSGIYPSGDSCILFSDSKCNQSGKLSESKEKMFYRGSTYSYFWVISMSYI